MAAVWYWKTGEEVGGPIAAVELKQLAQRGAVTRESHVRKGNEGNWVSAERVKGLFEAGDVASPASPPPFEQAPPPAFAPPPVEQTQGPSFAPPPVEQSSPSAFAPPPLPSAAQQPGPSTPQPAIPLVHPVQQMPAPGPQQMPVPGLQQMPAPAHPVALSVAPLAPGLKSKTTAVILAIIPLCGVFAAHDFYLGKTNKALIKLAIVFCTCFMGSAITGIWGIIDAILILTGAGVDGDGRPLI